MPAAEYSVAVNRSAEEVYAFVADGTKAMQWQPAVLDIAHVSGDGVGAVYRQRVKGPGGRRIAPDDEVTAAEPGKRLAFRAIGGPARPTGEYRLEPAEGGTRLTFSLDATVGGRKGLVMGRAVQQTMDSEVRNLDRLKAILEGDR